MTLTLPLILQRELTSRRKLSALSHINSRLLTNDSYTNHVVTHGAPLLDAYLFTTSENYLKTTRPALSNLLPWPLTWTVTPTLHAEARARTERLGISASEILAAETHEASTASTGSDIVPKSLRTTKESLSNLMRRPEHASRFRLEAMADHFLKPLRSLISDQQYMMSPSQMSSLDCVAIAYLALMLQPDAPQPWLRDIILQRYPALETYVETVLKHFVRANVATDKTLQPGDLRKGENKPNNTADGLPWQTWSTLSISDRISTIANSAMTNPLDATVIEHGRVVGKPGPQSTVPLLFGLLGLVTSIGTYLGYAYNEARRPKSTLSDMGEAGAMLGSLDFGMGDDRTSLPGEGRVPEQPNGTRMTFRRA